MKKTGGQPNINDLTLLLTLPNQDVRSSSEYYIHEATGQPYRLDKTSEYNYSTGNNDNSSQLVSVSKEDVKQELLIIASRDGAEHIHPKTLELMERFEIASNADVLAAQIKGINEGKKIFGEPLETTSTSTALRKAAEKQLSTG